MNPHCLFGQIAYLLPRHLSSYTEATAAEAQQIFAHISHYYDGPFVRELEQSRPIFFYRFLYIDIFSDIAPTERERRTGRGT